MWNPIDDIGNWLEDAANAVKQVVKSGGVKKATQDVANRAATSSSGSGYAAPARAMASQAALEAYNQQSKRYKDLALLADAVLTGGVADPLARAGSASIVGNNDEVNKALVDFGINVGASLAGQKAGEVLGEASEKAIIKALGKLNKILNDRKYEYGIAPIRPGEADVIKPFRWWDDTAEMTPGSFFFRTTNDIGEDYSDIAASEAARYLRTMDTGLGQIKNKDPRITFLMEKLTPGVAITKVPRGTFSPSVTPMYGRSNTGMRTMADQEIVSRIFGRPVIGEDVIQFVDRPTIDDIYERLLSIAAPSTSANVQINPAMASKLAQLAMMQAENER